MWRLIGVRLLLYAAFAFLLAALWAPSGEGELYAWLAVAAIGAWWLLRRKRPGRR